MDERVESLITLRGVSKHYPTPAGPFPALSDVDLEIGRGELVAVVGRSGSGKTTLLHLLAGIDRASSGTVRVAGTEIGALSESAVARWRGRHVGVVFQFFQLLPTLTVEENVVLPMELARRLRPRERRDRALELLAKVGIAEQATKLPATLSGGQQQRAAIARALANDPPLVVADEPTGNLDARTAADVWALFRALRDEGKTCVLVTHEPDVARIAPRTVTLADGRIVAPPSARRAAELAHA